MERSARADCIETVVEMARVVWGLNRALLVLTLWIGKKSHATWASAIEMSSIFLRPMVCGLFRFSKSLLAWKSV